MIPASPDAPRMTRRDCMLWLARAAAAGCALELCAHEAHGGDDDKKKDRKDKDKDKEKDKKTKDTRPEASGVNLMTFPNGKALETKGDYILTRTGHGVAALSVFCTHRRNRLSLENGIITCPVHGSEFSLEGKPLNGPATRALTWYAVQIGEDGEIRVDLSRQVAEGTWGALPTWAR